MSEQKLIISIPDSMRSGGLTFNHTGRTGRTYPFIWNDKYAAHIYLGRELSQKEFNEDIVDIFASHQGIFFPVPMAVIDPYAHQVVEEDQKEPAQRRKQKKSVKEEELVSPF
jgi:hypothetical protein